VINASNRDDLAMHVNRCSGVAAERGWQAGVLNGGPRSAQRERPDVTATARQ
jgi:hypothetical protein